MSAYNACSSWLSRAGSRSRYFSCSALAAGAIACIFVVDSICCFVRGKSSSFTPARGATGDWDATMSARLCLARPHPPPLDPPSPRAPIRAPSHTHQHQTHFPPLEKLHLDQRAPHERLRTEGKDNDRRTICFGDARRLQRVVQPGDAELERLDHQPARRACATSAICRRTMAGLGLQLGGVLTHQTSQGPPQGPPRTQLPPRCLHSGARWCRQQAVR